MKTKYKDPCDNCGVFDYCIGFDNMILCLKCYKQALNKNELKHHKSVLEKTVDINEKKKKEKKEIKK